MWQGEQRRADAVQPDEIAGSCPVSQPVSRAVRRWVEDHLLIMQHSRQSCGQVGHTQGVDVNHQPELATCLPEIWSLRQQFAETR